jgi:hypothetical protein
MGAFVAKLDVNALAGTYGQSHGCKGARSILPLSVVMRNDGWVGDGNRKSRLDCTGHILRRAAFGQYRQRRLKRIFPATTDDELSGFNVVGKVEVEAFCNAGQRGAQ